MEPVWIFAGCAPDGHDAESCAVLEHTLHKHSSRPVEIRWMIANRNPISFWSGWDMAKWATPFSGFRWAVPEFCGFEDRAIYMDSDTIVLSDIVELWETPIEPGKAAIARSATKFCTALFDCAAIRSHMLPLKSLKRIDGHDRQTAYFKARPHLVQPFEGHWNYLDSHDMAPLSEAKIVHYTDLATQPSARHARARLAAAGRKHWYDGPLRQPRRDVAELFERELAEARAAGLTVDRYVPRETFGELGKRSMVGYRARR